MIGDLMSNLAEAWQTEGTTVTEDATMPDTLSVPDNLAALTAGEPKFTRLTGVSALDLCDRHATVFAVVQIILPGGGELLMCGNCARKHFGYEHTSTAPAENKAKGSVH